MVAIHLFQFYSCNNRNLGVLVILLDCCKELMVNYVVCVNETNLSTVYWSCYLRDSFQPDLTLENMTSVCVTYWSLVGWFRHINKPTLGIST